MTFCWSFFQLTAGASTLRLIDDEELEAIGPDV